VLVNVVCFSKHPVLLIGEAGGGACSLLRDIDVHAGCDWRE
jgi:hypothetical protein